MSLKMTAAMSTPRKLARPPINAMMRSVTVVAVAVPEIMRTPEALAVFGPRCFGLDEPFTPIETMP